MHLQSSISSARSVKIRTDGLFEFLVLIVRMHKMLLEFQAHRLSRNLQTANCPV